MVFVQEIAYKKLYRWEYVINLDECDNIKTQCIACYIKNIDTTYLNSSGYERIPKEVEVFVDSINKHVKHLQNTSIKFTKV